MMADTKSMNMIEAINSALDIMLERDPDVVLMGEDIGYFGGVFRATAGLQAKHGKTRVFDTPISECGIIGAGVGMAAYGLRPVPEIQFADYIYPGLDQLVSEAARLRYRCDRPLAAVFSEGRRTANRPKACSPMSVASKRWFRPTPMTPRAC
jgi:2-oxoisovalerate dehydrogenase E1 component beta subunit